MQRYGAVRFDFKVSAIFGWKKANFQHVAPKIQAYSLSSSFLLHFVGKGLKSVFWLSKFEGRKYWRFKKPRSKSTIVIGWNCKLKPSPSKFSKYVSRLV